MSQVDDGGYKPTIRPTPTVQRSTSAVNRRVAPVSAVVPTIGRPELGRAITSIARQGSLPEEVIVVWNGPDEMDANLLSTFRAQFPVPIRILRLPPLSGVSIARNVGAWGATAPFVAFLDDDDEWLPGYLEAVSVFLDGADLVYTRLVASRGGTLIRKRTRLHDRAGWFESLYSAQNPGFGGSNVIVRRAALFALGGFRVDLPSGEDRALVMAALMSGMVIRFCEDAEVAVHTPAGTRLKGRDDKWITNLKLVAEYWSYVGWRHRSLAVYRVLRQFTGNWRRVRQRRQDESRPSQA